MLTITKKQKKVEINLTQFIEVIKIQNHFAPSSSFGCCYFSYKTQTTKIINFSLCFQVLVGRKYKRKENQDFLDWNLTVLVLRLRNDHLHSLARLGLSLAESLLPQAGRLEHSVAGMPKLNVYRVRAATVGSQRKRFELILFVA